MPRTLAAAPAEHLWRAQLAALRACLAELALPAAGPPPHHDADRSEWLDWAGTQAAITVAAALAKTRLLLAWWTQEALHGGHIPDRRMYAVIAPGRYQAALLLSGSCRDLAARLAAARWDPGQAAGAVRRRGVAVAQGHSEAVMRGEATRLLGTQPWARGWERRARPGACAQCRSLAARPARPLARPWHAPHLNCGCAAVPVVTPAPALPATSGEREAARLLAAVRRQARDAAAAMATAAARA
jgi:hypothetical protein